MVEPAAGSSEPQSAVDAVKPSAAAVAAAEAPPSLSGAEMLAEAAEAAALFRIYTQLCL